MFRQILAASFLVFVAAAPGFSQAQATTGTLQGYVKDQTGAVVPGAQVNIRQLETGLARAMLTDSTGYYRAASLPSGTYELTASQTGFSKLRRAGITLSLGQALDVDVTLSVAASAQEVTVEGTAAGIELTKTEVSTTISERQIEDLPINGRRFTDLALLTPGVTQDPRGLSGGANGDLSFGGLRGVNNNVQIDGADNNNAFYAQVRGRFRTPYNFSQSAVKEFQVVNSGFSAEFGKAAGAVVNVVTKSGSNSVHGEGFYFLRDSGVAARQAFASRIYKNRQQQFGGSVGGPVVKDKLFYFGNYDQQIFRVPLNVRLSGIPAADANSTDPAIQAAVATLRGFEGDFKSELLAKVFLTKADWIVNSRNTLSARYNFQNYGGANNQFASLTSPITPFAINETGTNKSRTDSAVVSLTSTLSSQSLNEFRFQFARDNQDVTTNSETPFVSISNVISGFGRSTTLPNFEHERRWQFVDNYSWNHGRHEFRTGTDISVLKIDNWFPGTFGGSFSFTNISNFVNNNPTTYAQSFGDPFTHPSANQYAFFAQDNWRARPNLNLNFGVRYELETYDTSELKANPLYPATGQIPVDKNNFAPRFGFSWTPFADRKTAIRGGYGIFYGLTPQIITSTAISGNGLRTQRYSLSGSVAAQKAQIPIYPAILPAAPNVAAAATDLYVFDKNFVNPYVQQANLAVERELHRDYKVSVTYIMTKGTRLTRSRDVNLFAPTPVNVTIFDPSGNQVGTGVVPTFNTATRPNSSFGRINTFESAGSSIYHGMAVSANKRWSRGYQFLLSYTLSKSIDDGQDALIVTTAGRIQNTYNTRDDRGLSVTDQRHRFTLSWSAEPKLKWAPGFSKPVLNDWKVSAITTIGSPRPIDPQASGDPNKDGNSGSDRTVGYGRNSMKGFGYKNQDLRLTRMFHVTESHRIEFITEFFNIFNHTNFLFGRNDDGFFRTHSAFSSTTNKFTLTSPFPLANDAFSPRQIQFALKYVF